MTDLIVTVGAHPVAGPLVLGWALVTVVLVGDKARQVARAWRGEDLFDMAGRGREMPGKARLRNPRQGDDFWSARAARLGPRTSGDAGHRARQCVARLRVAWRSKARQG